MRRPDSMRREPAVIGISLKMYFDPPRTLLWCAEVADIARHHPAVTSGRVTVVVLPSLPVLGAVVEAFAGTRVAVGAQDLFHEDRGAYTGAVSGADLKYLGCTYVEVGHVERRRIFGEDDRIVNLKVAAAWRNGLTPLLCVGEADRIPAAAAAKECIGQLELALGGPDVPGARVPLVVAYEPSWAIGAREPAGVQHVASVIADVRAWLDERPALRGTPVIYGGSAGEGLLTALHGTVNGLFLGRSVHASQELRSILDEAMRLP